jgi:diguanylate cyclase (GGDEF)-like protein
MSFSVVGTLLLMCFVSRFPGMYIPPPYWIFGAICPALISLPVSLVLVRQNERIQRLHIELSEAYQQLKDVAETDQLTEVLNRATFLRRAESIRSFSSGWILLLDVDHFKAVNDRYGHEVGDCALQSVAAILRHAVRARDLVGRLGGEEFAIYLSGANRQIAVSIAERVRACIADTAVTHSKDLPVAVTVSIGLASLDEAATVRECLHLADLAMYRAKGNGRNQVSLVA